MNPLTPTSLVLQVKASQVDRIGLLPEQRHRALFAFFYHFNGNSTAPEDLVQNVFYRLLKYRHTFNGKRSSRP